MVSNFAPEAKGHGVPEVMDAIYYNEGVIRPIVALVKSLASAVAIGSGSSVGREGPIIQIGAAVGSTLGQFIAMPPGQRIVLIARGFRPASAFPLAANPSSALNLANGKPRLRPLHLVVRETEFCGQRLAGDFSRRMRENGRNSVRRPRHASLTDRNCEGFCRPGNRGGLPGLYGGGCRDRTDGPSLQNEAACRGFRARNDLTQRMSK